MTGRNKRPEGDASSAIPWQELRDRAEARLGKKTGFIAENIATLTTAEIQQMLHELRAHQIELEMQNEALRESHIALDTARVRYFDLYDLAPIGYFTLSEQGQILQVNLTASSMLGISRSALVKQPFHRIILREDQDIFYLNQKHLIESGEAQSFELRIMKDDGSQFWASLVITATYDANGILELRVVLGDISERKQAEQALNESGERYHNLFNSIDEGFCVIEMIFDKNNKPVDYCYLEVNPSFEKQSGLRQVLGKRMSELVPELEDRWYEIYGKVALTGQSIRFVDEARQMDGRWFDVYAFRLDGLESRKVAVLFRDASDRKHAEAKLNEAKLNADKANLAKSEFLSSMSHELRTPLNAILGFAQLLDYDNSTPTQKRNINYILNAGWYLLELINEILDLAVIESGKLCLSMEAVSLAEVFHECEAMLESLAKERSIVMKFPHLDTPYFVMADRIRLKQVFVNLLSNAIKYNKVNGMVVVDCTAIHPGCVRISVEDTGDGLTAENLMQLFQPFNRLGKEASLEKGTGIGLVVSKRIVELMKGAIGVESTVGQGSVFWVELNLTDELHLADELHWADEPQVAAYVDNADTIALTPVQYAAQIYTILYVEDNPANLMLVEDIIARRPDINLLSAIDGHQGLEIARKSLPDAILMDISLPGISGIEALKMLAEEPLTAHIPVIALSANAIPKDIEKCLEAGFISYLTKPIKINEFMDVLDAVLKPE